MIQAHASTVLPFVIIAVQALRHSIEYDPLPYFCEAALCARLGVISSGVGNLLALVDKPRTAPSDTILVCDIIDYFMSRVTGLHMSSRNRRHVDVQE